MRDNALTMSATSRVRVRARSSCIGSGSASSAVRGGHNTTMESQEKSVRVIAERSAPLSPGETHWQCGVRSASEERSVFSSRSPAAWSPTTSTVPPTSEG